MSFEGKVILITGASSGIGADAAIHLAKLGAQVAIVGRNEERLDGVVEQIKENDAPTPLAISADVTKDAQRIVDETINCFGKLDVLVNNVGTADISKVPDINVESFDYIFDVNVRSVIILTQLCVPHLEETKGNIVNVSSVAGLNPMPNLASYCISKAALNQFSRCAAVDLAPRGIRVNSVNPAVIRTPIHENLLGSAEEGKRFQDDYGKRYPVGRAGEVADTSAAIAYLADDKVASFITGILLPVDGGAGVAGVN